MAATATDAEPTSSGSDGKADDLTETTDTPDLPSPCGDFEPGAVVWEDLFDGPVEGEDGVADVAVDRESNVYSVGWVETTDAPNSDDIWVRKFDRQGNEAWTRTFDGLALQLGERGRSIAVAPNGDIVFTGDEFETPTVDGRRLRLVRMTPEGDVVWNVVHAPAAGHVPSANDLAVRPDGTIFVVGSQLVGDTRDAWIVEYDEEGGLRTDMLVDAGVDEREYFDAITLMPDGGLVMVGAATHEAGGADDAWIRRIDADLNFVWEIFVDGDAGEDDHAGDVGVTPDGDIMVAGALRGPNRGDAWVAKFDDAGREIWSWLRDGARNDIDFATGMAVDGVGHVVVAGVERSDADGNPTPFLVKLDVDGNEIWAFADDVAELPQTRFVRAIAIDRNDCIVIGGSDRIAVNESYRGWTRLHAP
jgi:hypothetical protein